MANFCENLKNHGKGMPSIILMGVKTIVKQHLALTTIVICSARFSSVKFCRHGHILSHYVTKHTDFGNRGKRKVNILC